LDVYITFLRSGFIYYFLLQEILGTKPSLTLELDSHSADVGLIPDLIAALIYNKKLTLKFKENNIITGNIIETKSYLLLLKIIRVFNC